MGFSKALYYPTIDIGNWDWAKSAALFWDNIQTIVPQSMQSPYEGRVTKDLNDEGILTPHFVNPDMDSIRGLAQDVIKFLETNEGFEYLIKGNETNTTIHSEKLPRDVERLAYLHPEKLPSEVQYILENYINHDGWLKVDSRFARFYMSLLANKICEQERMVLLTDDSLASNVTEKARLDNQFKVFGRDRFGYRERYGNTTLHLSQGILSNLALKGIRFSPDTTIKKILKFKREHQDELGLFRNNLEKLVSDLPEDQPFETLQRHIEDIYLNEFKPSYNNFKKALDGYRLKWINDHVMKIAFFRGGTGTLLPFLLGATIPQALLAGAGISLITSVISYNQEKQEMLRNNPYSYLVSAENELSKDDFKRVLNNRIF
jgi:hypothetical protein